MLPHQVNLSMFFLLSVSLFNKTRCFDGSSIVMQVKKPFPRAKESELLPQPRNGLPVVVTVSLTINRLSNFNQITETFDADVNLKCAWQDGRHFNDGDQTVLMDAENAKQIWTPDLYFYNAQSITTHTIMKRNQYIFNGVADTIVYSVRVIGTFTCLYDLVYFPLDFQTCKITLMSYASCDSQMQLTWREWGPVQLAPGIIDGNHKTEMIVLGGEPTDCDNVKTFEDNNYYHDKTVAKTTNHSCVAVRFRLKRRPTSYIFETYILTAVIVFLSMFSFLLEPFSPAARVALCFTVFLTLATTMARANRFDVSYGTAIAFWMMVCNLFVFAALAEFAVVHFIVSQGLRAKPLPSEGTLNPPESARQKAWLVDKICLVVFPTSFTIFIIAYWCTFGINWNHHDGK